MLNCATGRYYFGYSYDLAGNLTQVKLLLEHGARRDLADAKGRTAVDLARAMGWEKIVRVLSE